MSPSANSSDDQQKHVNKKQIPNDSVINLNHGDPTMYVDYWEKMGDKCTIVIPGNGNMSYFSDFRELCWFLEREFEDEIRRLHDVVGNVVTEDRYIIVGTGSTQLFQAALYALSLPESSYPMNVVSAVPYYSSYPAVTDFLKSGLYKWAGDANTYDKNEPYIELVCSPNNPDGFTKEPVTKNQNGQGKLIYDFAYYWPQYTPIKAPVDHDLMLFTVSKCTGHAGTRLGWAVVKDEEVARKMTKFIELNTIGVSKDSQLRAAKILRAVTDSCLYPKSAEPVGNFFEYGQRIMVDRWARLRSMVKLTGAFTLPEYPKEHCNYFGKFTSQYPAFAWLKCNVEDVEDCESLFKNQKILVRGGKSFGVESKYVRVSMLDTEEKFRMLLERLFKISSSKN